MITIYYCETYMYFDLSETELKCLFIEARMHLVPPSHVHAQYRTQQSMVHLSKNVRAMLLSTTK